MELTQQDMWNVVKDLPEADKRKVVDFAVTLQKPKRNDIAKSGLDLGANITDENHDERMADVIDSIGKIKIDKKAVKDLREKSMI